MTPVVGILGALLLLGGGAALVWSGVQARSRGGVERLRAVLDDGPRGDESSVASLAVFWSRMTRVTDRAGRGTGFFTWLGTALERTGWALRPAEAALGVAGVAVVVGLLGMAMGGLLGFLLGAATGAVAPLLVLRRAEGKVAVKADRQLPDVLGSLASSMRSGHSLNQGMEAVVDHAPDPLGREFGRVLAETKVGRSFDDALEAMAERIGSNDLRWTVRAMIIQSRTGGRLADILEVLSEFMRDREEVRREVKALTADGRMSALVLGALPFLVAGALMLLNPTYLGPLFTEPLGWMMLAGGGVVMALAMMWIRKIIQVEV